MREEAHVRASEEREAACDFAGAATEALAGGDPRRALRLATLAGDVPLTERAISVLVENREEATRAAAELEARGFPAYAGAVHERLGDLLAAARAFGSAGDARRAADCFERAGKPRDAARELEAALRARPDDAACRLALGELLARHGRTEAAVLALQQIGIDAAERAAALDSLAGCLTQLGLDEAAANARSERSRLPSVGRGVENPKASPGPAASPLPDLERTVRRGNPSSVAGTLMFGRYEAVREVATSVHARVYEAIDRVTSERVAVKVFVGAVEGAGRDALVRFEREARALGRMRHPQVVALCDYLPEGPAVVLAWMPGGSLAERLRDAAITPARAVEIVGAVLAALGEAHRLGILHRDVKPANVLFDAVGAAHLSDFGAAHLGDLSSTATAGAIGTFAYMSPEQRLGRPATIASDVYGAGAILAELLTGAPPETTDDGALVVAPSARHPELGAAHDALVATLLARQPGDRPASAFEAKRMLEAVAWPDRPAPVRPDAGTSRAAEASLATARSRLGTATARGDGRDDAWRRHDGWIHRDVLVVPFDGEHELGRARAFARANHPTLPLVLRVDAAAHELWIAPPLGRALADGAEAPTAQAVARLGAGLAALHALGGAHGAIDAEHLYLLDGELSLAYPRRPSENVADDAERDLEALDALMRATPSPR